MSCFWFGHAPSGVTAHLKEQMRDDDFECRRCGKLVKWSDMPKAVRSMRDEFLRSGK